MSSQPAVSPPYEPEMKRNEGASEGEEGTEPKVPKVAVRPSAEEVDKHNANHVPFRSWCPYCVAGKAKQEPHMTQGQCEPCGVNVVSMDYAFIGKHPEKAGETGKEEESDSDAGEGTSDRLTVLVLRDRVSKYPAALVVPRKGDHPYTVNRVGNLIRDVLGHKKVVLKSDQESAIKKLKAAARREHSFEIADEMSAVGQSQSNGDIEITIQQVEGQMRTLKCHLDSRLGGDVPVGPDNLLVGKSCRSYAGEVPAWT